MADRLKELLDKVMEWWNKFSTRQKTFIIAAGAGVILAFAILITILTKPQYVMLRDCETTREASEIVDLLEGEGLDFEVSDDGYRIRINKKDESAANLLLGANNIQAYAYTIDNVTEGGMTTTESDREKRYELYLETRLANDIMGKFAFVKSAVVDITIPQNDGTLIRTEEETSALVVLELENDLDQDVAAGLGKAVAVSLGNKTAQSVMIMDTQGNTLYSGDDTYSITGVASSQLSVKSQWENVIKSDVRRVLMGTNEFDKVEVAVNLNVDFSTATEREREYFVPEGNTQGYLASERIYSSENVNESGEAPGTETNGTPEYVLQDGSTSSSTLSEEERDYLPSERTTERSIPAGTVNYDQSTISLAAVSINVIREEDVRSQGLLDGGVTWEEYKLNNQGQTPIEVEDSLYEVVSMATGFPIGNIAIAAYSQNVFLDREGFNISASDIIQIILIVVILALLAFVVLRSMRSEKEAEQPEELSVEALLQSQPEELENIAMEQVSETRKLIEKFVDDNPEAAANLLRNWLNEEWG